MFLVSEAIKYNKQLAEYIELAGKLTSQYLDERYPPGPITEFSLAEIGELLAASRDLIAIIKEVIHPAQDGSDN